MAYVKGCDWDIFVSYCQKNNQKNIGAENGWVDNLVYQLSLELEQRPEIGSPKIFIDYRGLLPGQDLDNDLKQAIQSSAMILVILSHRYLESGWCKMEREAFSLKSKAFARRVMEMREEISDTRLPSRICIVEYEKILPEKWPAEFRAIISSRMWTKDIQGKSTTLGWPSPRPDQPEYYEAISLLSRGIAKQLRALNQMAGIGN